MPTNNNDFILKYKPIQQFIDGVGQDVLKYIGKDKACIIGLGDDGIFFAEGIYLWLKNKDSQVVLTHMEHDGKGLEDSKVSGRKVLVVDNDIVSGTSYKISMNYLQSRKEELKMKDIKYAVLCDRTRLADFAAGYYKTTTGVEMAKLDSIDFKILRILENDGRASFAEIAEETNLTVSGAKKRVEKLIRTNVIRVRGSVVIEKFYAVSAIIEIEVNLNSMQNLISKIKKSQLVYLLLRVYAHHNLLVGVVASEPSEISDFVEKYISSEPGVKGVTIHLGDIPLTPISK